MANAQFNRPSGVALDTSGTLYVADTDNHSIRVIANGDVSTLAGDGTAGLVDGPAANARFNSPASVTLGSGGELYVADTGNHCIRVIANGDVDTLAGSGVAGYLDGSALQAQLDSPTSVVIDGNDLYVADSGNNRIRVIANGAVSTLAGSGAAGHLDGPAVQASFNKPWGIALAGPKMLFISDQLSCRVRMMRVP